MKKDGLQHIRDWANVYHRPQYKTAIIGEKPYLYHIVTRVNYLTSKLWLENVYNNVNGKKGFTDIPKEKPNWLCMIRQFRREQDIKISNEKKTD